MARVIMEQVFEQPKDDEEFGRLSRRLDECLSVRHGAWRRTYLSRDRRRMTCEFEAPDAESVREALRSAGLPFERVWAAECFAVEDYPEHLARLQALVAARADGG